MPRTGTFRPTPLALAAPSGSDAGVEDCTDKAFQRVDAELNEVWKKVLAGIGPDTTAGLTAEMATQWKADLIAAEKAWNTFKETDCNVARSYEYWGGSGRSLVVSSCFYAYTAARLSELKAHYVEDAYAQADAELNAVWRKVLASIQPGLGGTLTAAQAEKWKEDLTAAQMAWIALRDATCKGVRSFEYGVAGTAEARRHRLPHRLHRRPHREPPFSLLRTTGRTLRRRRCPMRAAT